MYATAVEFVLIISFFTHLRAYKILTLEY